MDNSQIFHLLFQWGFDTVLEREEGMILQLATTCLFYLGDFMEESIFLEAPVTEIQDSKATDSCSDQCF